MGFNVTDIDHRLNSNISKPQLKLSRYYTGFAKQKLGAKNFEPIKRNKNAAKRNVQRSVCKQ